jgi:hypothetical protein
VMLSVGGRGRLWRVSGAIHDHAQQLGEEFNKELKESRVRCFVVLCVMAEMTVVEVKLFVSAVAD